MADQQTTTELARLRADWERLVRAESNARLRLLYADAEIEELRDVLRKVEWGGDVECPCCCGLHPESHAARRTPSRVGHRNGCPLAAALAKGCPVPTA